MYYNRHRYYNPNTGQFISQDPIGLLGGVHNYQYVPNPTRWVDPLGLCKETVKLYHGTTHKAEGFVSGIDPNKGGGQLGPGFYATNSKEAATWYAEEWYTGGSDNPKLLELSIPKTELDKLKIITLEDNSKEYVRLTEAWVEGKPVPIDLQHLVNDYDAILAPMETTGEKVYSQIKFNPRAADFLSKIDVTKIDIT